MDLTVIDGGPLPFAFDILTTVYSITETGYSPNTQKTSQTISSSRFLRGIPGNGA